MLLIHYQLDIRVEEFAINLPLFLGSDSVFNIYYEEAVSTVSSAVHDRLWLASIGDWGVQRIQPRG